MGNKETITVLCLQFLLMINQIVVKQNRQNWCLDVTVMCNVQAYNFLHSISRYEVVLNINYIFQ